MFKIKRIYDRVEASDGMRVLVDRLWPRGLRKDEAKIDVWMKEIAPSNELRKRFHHKDELWDEFKEKYFEELSGKEEIVGELREQAKEQTVTLLYAARNEQRNNARALYEYLKRLK